MLNLRSHIAESWSHLHDRKLFLACSGGVDSIALLHLLHEQNHRIEVIHVNYQLRGEDSDLDAQCVQENCALLGIPFEIRKVALASQLAEGGNLQELARNIRYAWFQEILLSDPRNCIVLAHHADDQVETFFMNLARKSGVMGLSCMPAERGSIYRPLLNFCKKDLIDFAKSSSIQWREDRSNESSKYRRNLLRNEIIPTIRQEIPTIDESVLLLIQHFQELQSVLETDVQFVVKGIKEQHSLLLKDYDALDQLKRIEVFRQLKISSNLVERIEQLRKLAKGKKIALNHPIYESIVRDHDQFTFIEKQSIQYTLKQEFVTALPLEFSKNEVYLDASKIKGDLILRKWQLSDRMAPIGVNGTQLLSDIIKGSKINALKKQEVLVLHDAAAIHWCVGLKVGRLAVATPSSSSIMKCSITVSEAQQ